MTMRGDNGSFDLGDLLHSFETHGKSGRLVLTREGGDAHLLFAEGKVTAFSAPGRPTLPEMLVASGAIDQRQLANATRKRGRSRRPLCEVLVGARAIDAETLFEAAEGFLFDALADAVAAGCAAFDFAEGAGDPGRFDPEELSLELAIPVGSLLLEAARRQDHWALVRKVIPSDTAHFVARTGACVPEDIDDQDLAARLLDALDGTRCVAEVGTLFAHARFATYLLLERFVRERLVRTACGDDLAAIAASLRESDPARARRVVRRGLESEAHHQGLLLLEARLAEGMDDHVGAAAALKLLAHLKAELGESGEPERLLIQARRLAPADPAISERMLALLLEQGRREDAIAEGRRLVELYRAPGLHTKAREVLARLVALDPGSIELRIALAREQVDCGEAQDAVRALLRLGKHLVAREGYAAARAVFGEVLAIDAVSQEAKWSVEMIDKETFARRRERARRLRRLVVGAVVVMLTGVAATFEARARADFLATTSRIDGEELIEERRYEAALELYREVAERHPITFTTWIDVERRMADLEAKLVRVAQPPR